MSIKSRLNKAWKKVTAGIAAGVLAVLSFLGLHDAQSAGPTITDSISWTYPTQNIDGSALAASDIALTRIVWGDTPGGPYPNTQDVAAPGLALALIRPGEGYGRRCYRASVITTVARGSLQGLWSGEGCKTVNAPPNQPGNFAVQ
jgi:hypothetical protein